MNATILSNPWKQAVWKIQDGWIDRDVPNVYWPTRRQARLARRNRLAPVRQAQNVPTTVHVTTADPLAGLSALQRRLYSRLVNVQGVEAGKALAAVTTWGYNKAASYGYMRAAGATHEEASAVVGRNDPAFSLTYGKARVAGQSHNAAFLSALHNWAL